MYISNKDIRARARYLLDDNIFGKDWIKISVVAGVVLTILYIIAMLLVTVSSTIIGVLTSLLVLAGVQSNIFFIIAEIFAAVLSILASAIVMGPFFVGSSSAYLDLERGEGDAHIVRLFDGFKRFFENSLLSFMYMLQIFLWTLLGIIPGIYFAFSYAMVFYVKHDNPEFTWKQCFDESERLMAGNRWRYFKLQMSFYGWYLLGAIGFFGIGSFWAMSYAGVSTAVFYDLIKEEKDMEEEY